jgi:hypothetical protein
MDQAGERDQEPLSRFTSIVAGGLPGPGINQLAADWPWNEAESGSR